MSFKILNPGLLTTIQDRGRHGYQRDGIIVSGAMDVAALRIANILVRNQEAAAALEMTLTGPGILFEEDHLIAITGADLSPQLNGEPVKMWRPVYVPKGSVLQFGRPVMGCRAYLAVSGSFAIPPVMGSYATYLRAGIGGLHGKALRAGDIIPCRGPVPAAASLLADLVKHKTTNSWSQATWTLAPPSYPAYNENPVLRTLKGPEYNWFTRNSQIAFWQEPFRVTAQSDRMGYRLQGPALSSIKKAELLSSAVTFGTVQVPAQGNPIVLMADHQTTGGYPRIAQVISADYSVLAQVPPGKMIRFREITLPEAQQLLLQQELNIRRIKQAVGVKLKW